jgi:hypothetical protein
MVGCEGKRVSGGTGEMSGGPKNAPTNRGMSSLDSLCHSSGEIGQSSENDG